MIRARKKNYTAKHIILATGARSRELPNLAIDGKKDYWLPEGNGFG